MMCLDGARTFYNSNASAFLVQRLFAVPRKGKLAAKRGVEDVMATCACYGIPFLCDHYSCGELQMSRNHTGNSSGAFIESCYSKMNCRRSYGNCSIRQSTLRMQATRLTPAPLWTDLFGSLACAYHSSGLLFDYNASNSNYCP